MFADSTTTQNAPIFLSCASGAQLLHEPHVWQAWQNFRECIPISDDDFDSYYTAVLITFAEYVQTLPASQHVFYATAGGFLQLGLDRAITATKLALQAYQDFDGRSPAELTVHDLIELFAVFSAALLSDLGLLNLRFQIKVNDHSGVINDYDPYFGSMLGQGKLFAYQFRQNELVDWSAPASLVLAKQVMCQTQDNYRDTGFAWISRHHDILQLWYAMLLELTPAQETSTRRRYLIALIPYVDNEIVHDFLINMHNNGSLLPSKQNLSLFNIQNQDPSQLPNEATPPAQADFDLAKLKKGSGFDKIFGGSTLADSSNAVMLGSVSTTVPPLLRYGLAFLGWLLVMARTPGQSQLYGADGPAIFGLPNGKVAFDVQKLQKLFAQEFNFPNISPQDLVTALQKIQVLQAQKISLSQLGWKGDIATQFTALILPVQFVFGNVVGPKIAMDLIDLGKKALAIADDNNSKPSLFGKQNRNRLIFGG